MPGIPNVPTPKPVTMFIGKCTPKLDPIRLRTISTMPPETLFMIIFSITLPEKVNNLAKRYITSKPAA